MAPLQLSYIWYRRLYLAIFIVSTGYAVLYALPLFNIQYIPEPVAVDGIAGIAGLIVAIACAVQYILVKKITSFLPAFITFAALSFITAYLVQSTGGVNSSFIGLWSIVIFIAPIFAAYGWLPGLVITSSYVASEYLSGGLTTQTIVLVSLSSIIPLIAGVFLWRNSNNFEDQSTRNVKHLASQLSEVATKSEIVINAIGDGVIAVDGKGVIQLINPAAQEILGWGKQDALMLGYQSILKLVDTNGADIAPSQDPIQQVLNTNQQARTNKLTAVTKSGKKLSLAIAVSPIGDTGAGAITVFRDTTKERAEEREQAEFISTASHEMRTPVASIEGYLGLALNPNTATIDIKARDYITKAHEAAQHLGRLFQDLLDVSKSEDGRMGNTPKVVDIVPFTQTIVQGLTQKAVDKGLNLVFVPEEGNNEGQGIKKLMPVYYINLDNDHIREILDNLIENAIKYTPQGEVRVDISGSEEKVVISIKDSGLGIPAEDIPHLFQKFYRVNNIDRQSIGGTGLGLYLCRRLVEAMQGRLWVESTFGAGSTFFVELPRIDSQEATRLKAEQERLAVQIVTPATTAVPNTGPVALTPVTPAATATATSSAPSPLSLPTAASTPLSPPLSSSPAKSIPVTYQPPAAAYQQQPTTNTPSLLPTPSPSPSQTQSQTTQESASTTVAPATTVPRGEALTREQINERVRQLEVLAQQQRGSVTPPTRQ